MLGEVPDGREAERELLLNDLTCAELIERTTALGITARVARRLFARVHERSSPSHHDFRSVKELPHRGADLLYERDAYSGRIEILTRSRDSRDGFVKYLFRLADGELVESVLIPLPAGPDSTPAKYVMCVSSQVGCPLGCGFCATGRLGFTRNLATWEIVEQVARVRDEVEHPIRGVVFMGMGEPLLNYDAVLAAADIFSDPSAFAIAKKAITISTAGIIPAIRRFSREGHQYRLAVSLHSAIPEKRRALVPIDQKYPLEELLAASREHAQACRDRITLEYVMISGVNMGEEDARALIRALAGMRVRLNLIEVNDDTGRFIPPNEDELACFRGLLMPLGQPIVRRYSGGKNIAGACGMLAATARESEREIRRTHV